MESVNAENLYLSMVSLHKEDDHVIEDKKERQSAEGILSSEPEKAHSISKFVIVAVYCFIWPLLALVWQAGKQTTSFVTVVRQVDRPKIRFWFLFFLIQ